MDVCDGFCAGRSGETENKEICFPLNFGVFIVFLFLGAFFLVRLVQILDRTSNKLTIRTLILIFCLTLCVTRVLRFFFIISSAEENTGGRIVSFCLYSAGLYVFVPMYLLLIFGWMDARSMVDRRNSKKLLVTKYYQEAFITITLILFSFLMTATVLSAFNISYVWAIYNSFLVIAGVTLTVINLIQGLRILKLYKETSSPVMDSREKVIQTLNKTVTVISGLTLFFLLVLMVFTVIRFFEATFLLCSFSHLVFRVCEIVLASAFIFFFGKL
jgi:hypothetical protein